MKTTLYQVAEINSDGSVGFCDINRWFDDGEARTHLNKLKKRFSGNLQIIVRKLG
jgi:hypothetical protein